MHTTREKLYEDAIRYHNCKLSSTGALVAYSGERTGRSPKDKRVVFTDKTKNIWWGNINIPIQKELYDVYKYCAILSLKNHYSTYVVDSYAGWRNQLKIRIYCYSPYHALFMQNMLIPASSPFTEDEVDFTIYNVGHLKLSNVNTESLNITGAEFEKMRDMSLKDTLVGLDLEDRTMVIYGTEYAGEMKKGVLTYMMYEMVNRGYLPLHSSANIDIEANNISLFFGLSGTGKTTLSADSKRHLIGDDEHVWCDDGIFNIEGGCYAKCVNLNPSFEPDIFNAIRYGTVLENICMSMDRVVDYNDISITENTRASYPLNYISKVQIPAIASHPNHVILLTCDALGLLPPVAKLNHEQAVFMFVCGYTTVAVGTEVGVKEPIPVFSACFGEPFLIWSPKVYGDLLRKKLEENPNTNVWMVNTGWIDGEYGKGKRISIKHTRSMIDAIHFNGFDEYESFPYFNFLIPKSCKDVPSNILNPINSNQPNYLEKLEKLHNSFNEVFSKKYV
jgi:phosphoenolpyruvate carboxykinase (ATP)